jgi:hypothetical protein
MLEKEQIIQIIKAIKASLIYPVKETQNSVNFPFS